MSNIDLAYLPVVGRGLQIRIICEMHNIDFNYTFVVAKHLLNLGRKLKLKANQ